MTNGRATSEHDEAAGGDDHQLDPAEQPAADVGDDRRARRRSTRSPSTGSVVASCAAERCLVVGAVRTSRRAGGGELDAVEDLVDERRWRRPCPARPRA